MPAPDEMTIDERRKYVKLMASRYQHAKRKECSQLLTEMQQVTKLHRKHLIRLLNAASLQRKKRQKPRSRTYGREVEHVILRVWESLDYICAERLTPSLLKTALHLAKFGVLVLTAEVESQLARISVATVERRLAQASFPQSALTASWASLSQPGDQGCSNETHCLGHPGCGAF
jgi:hypothetical protein